MTEKTSRSERIKSNLHLEKLSPKLNIEVNTLGLKVSNFIHHIFKERVKS